MSYKFKAYPNDPDTLFNVAVNGKDVATLVSRKAAEKIMEGIQRPAFIQIYLSSKPLHNRKQWHKQPLPRPWSFRVTAIAQAKALAAVLADPEIICETELAEAA